MLCRVEMPSNEAAYGRLYRWRLLKQGGAGPMFLCCILPFLIAGIALWFWWMGAGVTLLLGLLVLSLAYSVYTLYIKPGQQFRQRPGAALETVVYILNDTGYTRSVRQEESDAGPDNESGQYEALHSAVETKQDFYLFYGPSRAWIVEKEYFTMGSPEALRETLAARMGERFKPWK